MATFGKFVLGFSYWVIGLMFSAYVFSILFGWFIVPLGLPAISIAQAFGISSDDDATYIQIQARGEQDRTWSVLQQSM